jgi:hypothetical protein
VRWGESKSRNRLNYEEVRVRPRITLNLTTSGELEIWLNEAGRNLLVQKLQALGESNDHFHLAPAGMGEVEVSTRAYQSGDRVIEWGKVLFRTDEWDRRYFPHVLDEDAP